MAEFTQGDTGSVLRATLYNRDGSIFDLTGYTVVLKFRIAAIPHPPVTMTILDPLAGTVEYNFIGSPGFEIVTGNNDKLDIKIMPVGTVVAATIAPGTYTTQASLATAIQTALNTMFPTYTWFFFYDLGIGFTFLTTGGDQYKLLTGTGVNLSVAAWNLIGFNTGTDSISFDQFTSDFDPQLSAGSSRLSEEGIMYAEIEVTETISGNKISNSEVMNFVVRGKVV